MGGISIWQLVIIAVIVVLLFGGLGTGSGCGCGNNCGCDNNCTC